MALWGRWKAAPRNHHPIVGIAAAFPARAWVDDGRVCRNIVGGIEHGLIAPQRTVRLEDAVPDAVFD